MDSAHPERFRALADLTDRLFWADQQLMSSLNQVLADGPLHPKTVRRLAAEFGLGWSPGRLALLASELAPGSEPVGTVAVVAPGNLFVAAWQAVLEPWLCGNRVRVRPSTDDGGAIAWLVDQLATRTPQAAAIALDPWLRGDAEASRSFFAGADALALWGGDLALAELGHMAAAAGFAGPLRLHGPRTALAIIDATQPPNDPTLASLACDVVLGDGRGCMGVGQVWWHQASPEQATVLHDRLWPYLLEAALRLPAGPGWAVGAAAAQMRSEALAVAADLVPGARLSARPDGWLFTAADLNALRAIGDVPGRCVGATPMPASEMTNALAALRATVSVLVTNLPDNVARGLAQDLGCRWCRPGRAQEPRADQGHDGYQVFEGFVRPATAISGRRAGA